MKRFRFAWFFFGLVVFLLSAALLDVRSLAAATIIEDQDPSIQYDDWRGVVDSNANGGSYRVSNVAGANSGIINFGFTGTAVTWISIAGPDQGIAQVSIDGVSQGSFDLYSPLVTYNVQQTFGNLVNTSHKLTVKVSGSKNASSTGLNVIVNAFTVNGITTNANSSSVFYNNWQGVSSSNASGGTYRQNANSGTDAQFSFTGTSISWITALGPKYGQANVLIDGSSQGLVDLYSATQQYQVAYTYSGLSAGQHSIEVKPTGTMNSASVGTTVVLDSFSVASSAVSTPTNTATSPPTSTATSTPQAGPSVTPTSTATSTPQAGASVTPTSTTTPTATPSLTNVVIDDKNSNIQYDSWRGYVDANANGGTYRVSNIPGPGATTSTVSTSFNAPAITWLSRTGPDQGEAEIYIDNVSQGVFDMYSPTVQYNVQHVLAGLTSAAHTLRLTVQNNKNSSSTGYNVVVDGFIVNGVTIQDTATTLKYGRWEGKVNAAASGGTYRQAATSNGDAKFSFIGTSITWVTALGPKLGQATVLIDGVSQGTFDLYAPVQQWQVPYTFSGLSMGQHTIELKPLGTKNVSSQGTYVVLDAFSGPLTPVVQP